MHHAYEHVHTSIHRFAHTHAHATHQVSPDIAPLRGVRAAWLAASAVASQGGLGPEVLSPYFRRGPPWEVVRCECMRL